MSAGAEIRVASAPGEHRIAVVTREGLAEYRLWRPGAPGQVGELHRARILASVPAMAGAFVALAGGEGFLPDTDNPAGGGPGTYLAVRITRAAQGGKGPRVTARVAEPAGSGPPALLAAAPSPVLEIAAAWPEAPVRVDSRALQAALSPALGARVSAVAEAFDAALEDEAAALAAPEAALPGGMRAIFTPAPALTAIDVDGGATTAAREGKARAQVAANLAAIPALARQIRLRNLSGALLIDFAGIPARRRAALGPALRAALAADPLAPELLGFTALGFAEIRRRRVHPPLHDLLAGPHAAGLAALRAMVREFPQDAPVVLRAATAVVAALAADGVALAEARHHTSGMRLLSDESLAPCGWRLERPHAG